MGGALGLKPVEGLGLRVTLRVQIVLIYGFLVPIKAPTSLNNEYLDP